MFRTAIDTATHTVNKTFFQKTEVPDDHAAKDLIKTLDKVRYGAGIVATAATVLLAWKMLGVLLSYGVTIELGRETALIAGNMGKIRLNDDLQTQAKESSEKCAELMTEKAPFAQALLKLSGADLRDRVLSAPAA